MIVECKDESNKVENPDSTLILEQRMSHSPVLASRPTLHPRPLDHAHAHHVQRVRISQPTKFACLTLVNHAPRARSLSTQKASRQCGPGVSPAPAGTTHKPNLALPPALRPHVSRLAPRVQMSMPAGIATLAAAALPRTGTTHNARPRTTDHMSSTRTKSSQRTSSKAPKTPCPTYLPFTALQPRRRETSSAQWKGGDDWVTSRSGKFRTFMPCSHQRAGSSTSSASVGNQAPRPSLRTRTT